MKTFAITTLGCKVNQYEGRQICELLERFGLQQVPPAAKPDLVVVNSCCVTHIASAKCRNYINRARKLSPRTCVVVRGCLPTAQTGELDKIDNGVHLIGHRRHLPAELAQIIFNAAKHPAQPGSAEPAANQDDPANKPVNAHKIKNKNDLSDGLAAIKSFGGQTRAFLKVQDGCDGFCTYCIVPKIRTEIYTKPLEQVLAEAKNLVASGHKEIVVTGIFLGAYGRDTVRRKNWQKLDINPLADLLDKLAQVQGLCRLRLSSLEPADVTDELLDVLVRHKEVIAPHLHLPLQSGSDAVLKRMRRQYTVSAFRKTVEKVKSRLDRPAITTDILVGFPGETDDDFNQTVAFAKEVAFSKMHVFPFSPRKGTAAVKLPGRLASQIVKERAKLLSDLDKKMQEKFRCRFLGETVNVLVESTAKIPHGRSERYFLVNLDQKNCAPGDFVAVKLTPDALAANTTEPAELRLVTPNACEESAESTREAAP